MAKTKTGEGKTKGHFGKSVPLLLIALPGIVYLLINNYIPIMGLFLAFKDFNFMKGIFKSDWCGLDNFKFLFLTKDAWIMTRNTLLYNIVFIILGTVVAIFLAVLLCELGDRVRVKFFQASLLLPNLLSWVVIGFVAYAFLNADTGFINNTVMKSLGKEGIAWYTFPKAWPFILVIVNLWKNAGYQSIVYMAGISGIDKSLYEAAELDGATKLQRIRHIDLPTIQPTIIMLLIMNLGNLMSVGFEKVYLLQNDLNFATSDIISTYVYRVGLVNSDFGYSTTVGLFNTLINLLILVTANTVARKATGESLW